MRADNENELLKLIERIPDEHRGALLQRLTATAYGVEKGIWRELPDTPPLTLLSADEILTTEWPEPVWAVPGLLPSGLAILAGKSKIGKSWLALQLAQAVGAGGRFFGHDIEQGPVLYLALEDSPRRLRDRMNKQGWPPGLPVDFLTLTQFMQEVGDLKDGGGERVARQIEKRGYRLVIVDTLSRAVCGDQSDVDAMTRALSPIQEIALSLNCATVMVDHHNKRGGFGTNPDAVGDILGSTAKGALADTIWGLYRERSKTEAKLCILGRDVLEQDLALHWDWYTACWECLGDANALKMTKHRQEIVDALEGLGRASLKEIAETVDQPQSNTHTRLQELVTEGMVVRIEEGGRVFYELGQAK